MRDRSPAHKQWTQRFLAFNFFRLSGGRFCCEQLILDPQSFRQQPYHFGHVCLILSVAVPTLCVRPPCKGLAKTLRSTIPVLRSTAITICCCCNRVLRIILSNSKNSHASAKILGHLTRWLKPTFHQNPSRRLRHCHFEALQSWQSC
jgi:hypothetical protein